MLTRVLGSSTMREYLQAFRDEWNKARLFALKLDDVTTTPSVEVAKFCSQNRLALLKAGKKFTKHAPSVNLTTSLGDFRGDRLGFDDALRFRPQTVSSFWHARVARKLPCNHLKQRVCGCPAAGVLTRARSVYPLTFPRRERCYVHTLF